MASAIHCGLLPTDYIPEYAEFTALPYYDRTSPELVGQPYFMGQDENGNAVYFMGMWSQRAGVKNAIVTMLDAAEISRSSYLLHDAFPLINFSTKLGGLLSKRYRLTGIGRRITVWGMRRQYPQFVALVDEVKRRLK